MKTLINGGTIINEGKTFQGSVTITDGFISDISTLPTTPRGAYDNVIDATGCYILPGIIDTHVHFREPGLTHKADITTESRAAAAGGVTTIFDMPNTNPQTTTPEALEDKFNRGKDCRVNYSFFYGATNDNADTFSALNRHRIPGIKLFMGSSTGNMLVDKQQALDHIFATAARLGLLIMAHCEDSSIIQANMEKAIARYGDDPNVSHHPEIRSTEACLSSTKTAIMLAQKHKTRLHIAHISTKEELSCFEQLPVPAQFQSPLIPDITAEAVISHLLFSAEDYEVLGSRIKCNPAIKGLSDRTALRASLNNGRICVVSTDHAPHLLDEKKGGARRACSGMPMVQFSLPAMLSLADEGIISLPRIVELMAHYPAMRFNIDRRGFLRVGYHADITLVRPDNPWVLRKEDVLSKCGWSPLEGRRFAWRVEKTIVSGRTVYDNGAIDDTVRGEEVRFL